MKRPVAADHSSLAVSLVAAAEMARRRLAVIYLLRGLRKTVWLPATAVPLLIALRLSSIRSPELAIAIGFIIVWVLVAVIYAWRRWPTRYAALAAWDQAAQRKDLFSSALIFEKELAAEGEASDPGRVLHIERARIALTASRMEWHRELPLPRSALTWLAPAIALAVTFLPWLKPQLSAGDSPMTARMLAAARAEAEKLLDSGRHKTPEMKELSDEEKRRLEELRKSIQDTASGLKDSEDKTPREVLAELEKRAREAEDLAKRLGADNSSWASEQMLGEMRRHPDTADLAASIKDREAGRSATQSREIAQELKDPQLTSEAAERMRHALDRTMEKAVEDDKKKMVGQHVGAADDHMEKQNSAGAAEEFAKLAEKFQRQEQRENAQKELEKLAERLRQSGSSIMGQNNQGMKKLAGQQSGSGSQAATMPDMTPLGKLEGQHGDSNQLPIPGLSQIPDIKFGEGRGSPIPGTGKLGKDAKALSLIPGTGEKPQMALPLAAPIPGTAPGAGVIIGASGAGGNQGMPGGLLAGRGHVPSGNSASKPKAAGAQGEVAAAINDDGESFVRSIEGQPHEEAVLRAAKKTAAEFVKVQEEAFDEQSLPLNRREQVKRYFEAIRRRFEE